MPLLIEPAKSADLREIAALEEVIEGDSAAGRDLLQARLMMFREGFLVARESGRIIAYAESCIWDEEIPSFRKEADFFSSRHHLAGNSLYIIFLGVAPESRRHGVASKLIAALLEVGKRYCVKRIHAVTWEYLVPLYTGQGFMRAEEIKGFLPNSTVRHIVKTI